MSVCSVRQFQTQFPILNPLALDNVATSDPKSRPDPHHAKSRLRGSRAAKLAGFDDYQGSHAKQSSFPDSLRSKVDFEPHGPLALYTLRMNWEQVITLLAIFCREETRNPSNRETRTVKVRQARRTCSETPGRSSEAY